jgi:hypothetical protein
MKRSRVAWVAQGGLAAYFQAIQWLPLGRWNYQPGFYPLATQAAQGRLAPADVALVAAFALPVVIYMYAHEGEHLAEVARPCRIHSVAGDTGSNLVDRLHLRCIRQLDQHLQPCIQPLNSDLAVVRSPFGSGWRALRVAGTTGSRSWQSAPRLAAQATRNDAASAEQSSVVVRPVAADSDPGDHQRQPRRRTCCLEIRSSMESPSQPV